MRITPSIASAMLAALPAAAGPPAGVVVRIDGIAISRGTLYLSLCRRAEFATMRCARSIRYPITRAGAVTLRFDRVPPGTYAVLAMQDVNGNRRLDRDPWGAPSEPVAMSGQSGGAGRVPSFEDSAIRHTGSTTPVRLGLQ